MSVFPQSVPTATPTVATVDGAPSPHPDAPAGARVFRGRSLDELLPRIRVALGPDAVVLRRREGLEGGALGFFQTRFVEVEAVAGRPDDAGAGHPGGTAAGLPGDAARGGSGVAPGPRFDAYDAGDAWPEDVPDDGVRWLDASEGPAAASAALAGAATVVCVPADGTPAPVAAPWAATAAGIAPIDGAAFLRHLDAAVERRRADETAAPRVAETRDPAGAPGRAATGTGDDGAAVAGEAGEHSRRPAARRGLLDRADLAGTADDEGDAVRPFAGLARTVAPWTPARADDAPRHGGAERRTGGAASAVLTAPGSGEVRVVAGPASGRLELRDDEQVAARAEAIPSPARRQVGSESTAAASSDLPSRRTSQPGAAAGRLGGFDAIAAPSRGGVDQDVAEYGLIARGLSPALARSVVREAAAHGRPVDPGQRMDRATRAALALRIPRPGPRDDVRTIAVVGGPGAGRTSAVAALAVAHARAGRSVVAVALGAADGGAALGAAVVGSDVELLVAGSGAAAAGALGTADADLVVVDTSAVRPSDPAGVAALAAELRALGADETLLAIPGDHATAAVHDVADGLAGLRADALVMTHRDRAERPGGLVGASIVRGFPIAYVTDGRAVALADPARLARMVQP